MFYMNSRLLLSAFAAVLLVFPILAQAKDSDSKKADVGDEVKWSYEGAGGPENWGKLKEDFKACDLGKAQSPFDLKETVQADLADLEIDYKAVPLTVLNNGHTIQVNVPKGSKFTVDGERFDLLQFHFHAPSEYAIEGKRSDMSAHFVHKNSKGELGVIGVMIEKGKENSAAQAIWNHMPQEAGEAKDFPETIVNVGDFFPEDKTYYRLMGSLTTPPCSENVHWHVLKEPIEFSKVQIKAFKALLPMNARPLQKKNNRLIILDK